MNKFREAIKYFKKSLKYHVKYYCLNDVAIAFIKKRKYFKGNKYLTNSLLNKPDYMVAIQNKAKLKNILSVQKKYFVWLILLFSLCIFLFIINKPIYSISMSIVILFFMLTKKIKPGINLSFGEFKFSFVLGEYDYTIDENYFSWILSIQKDEEK